MDLKPDALPPEQENLVAAIWSSILLFGEATPTIDLRKPKATTES